MRHLKATLKLGKTGQHRKAMFANQVSSLIVSGEIRTTVEKAKATKRLADRMVTLAKKGTLHHRRLAVSRIRDEGAVKRLFEVIAPSFSERKGGYTRIIRLGVRRGDAAEVCLLRWTGHEPAPARKKKAPKAEAAETAKKTDAN